MEALNFFRETIKIESFFFDFLAISVHAPLSAPLI